MRKCLLVGNGLNRCIDNEITWGNLLKKIAMDYRVEYNSDINMPMEFERIINEYQRRMEEPSDDIYDSIKKELADLLIGVDLPNEAIHRKLNILKPDSIITTNYDCLLEYAFDEQYRFAESSVNKNAKYLKGSTFSVNSIDFYHMHGIVYRPKTICLGYEHYMGVVEHYRRDLNTMKQDSKTYAKKAILKVLEGEMNSSNPCGELFYTHDIAIIGLGLYESEVDLWWLLTHRASLYYSNIENARNLITNKIVYYDIVNDIDNGDPSKGILDSQMVRHELLKGMHVEVRTYKLSEHSNYKMAYNAIIEDIRKSWQD